MNVMLYSGKGHHWCERLDLFGVNLKIHWVILVKCDDFLRNFGWGNVLMMNFGGKI